MHVLQRFSVQQKQKIKCLSCSDFGQKYLAKMPAGYAANGLEIFEPCAWQASFICFLKTDNHTHTDSSHKTAKQQ